MSVLKSLNFIALPKALGNDPKLARRHKLVTQLQQQRALAEDGNYVVPRQKWIKREDGSKTQVEAPKRVKRWWRLDASGNCYLVLRYGNKIIAPSPDKTAISVGDKSKLVNVLDAVIAAAQEGELDAAIDTIKGAQRVTKRKAS